MSVVAELAPYDYVSRNKFDLFPNVSGIQRKFLWIEFFVFPICVVILIFASSLPMWLVLAVSSIIIVVGVLGLIGTWGILFGDKGVFRNHKP